jgi:hypothetical protein
MPELPRSILDTLKSIDQTEDKDIAFIFAASINLYIETIRRLKGRVMLGPDDIPHILDIIATLTQRTPDMSKFTDTGLRPRVPTEEEEANVLKAVESELIPERRAV